MIFYLNYRIDKKGNVVIKLQYQFAKSFREGKALVCQNGKYGYVNAKGIYVIQPQYSSADSFSEGLAAVVVKNKYGYIDQSGKIVKKELARDYIVKDIKKIIVQENGIMNIEYKSYEKYFKLVEKHRCLLDIFLPESNYDKAKEIINSRINMVKEDILVQLDSKKNMDIKK